ncbi:hypothetical protein AMAG_03222 [Allomyces macrogynus ATCC 38327]|uniref:Uncharacterized protein n=1 Tax=Allomyces macrogynus (strain ATCC 38327) TaxID=578462 RepID=A0A0L0S533_ALLM3|nr:hypothetical protein AMAG_03222 [Allomyces macrogynus ATCC 38327]|eukprot:KNE57516.1 hypothetical protein AMAG_03222 [Allomyces macrogynus ATCC 38327]
MSNPTAHGHGPHQEATQSTASKLATLGAAALGLMPLPPLFFESSSDASARTADQSAAPGGHAPHRHVAARHEAIQAQSGATHDAEWATDTHHPHAPPRDHDSELVAMFVPLEGGMVAGTGTGAQGQTTMAASREMDTQDAQHVARDSDDTVPFNMGAVEGRDGPAPVGAELGI